MNRDKLKKKKKLIYDLMRCKEYQPMRAKDIAILMEVPAGRRKELHEVLNALLEEGKISLSKRGRYEAVISAEEQKDNTAEKLRKEGKRSGKKKHAEEEYVTGTFLGHPKGFGFVQPEEEDAADIYIPESEILGAMHLDKVQVRLQTGKKQNGSRREGSIVKILEHGMKQVVGTYQKSNSFGFVVPDNARISKDIYIYAEHSKGAVTGDKVVAEIRDYGSKNKSPEGRILEILGHYNEAGVDVLSIAKSYELPMEFPQKVQNQAERIPDRLQEGDFYRRMDLRDWTVVTIDGEDAKDLDDGISLTKDETGYHLGVHIADVSNYVQYNSALDKEALKRGTSVYLVDRVIPMLPPHLSNGICSLNQGEDRLALSCLMDIDEKGNVVNHQIAETVICVDRRMTYTNVKKILEQEEEGITKEYEELVPLFFLMRELSGILRKKREKRGSIDFDFPESKILLNKQGIPVEIYPYEHNVATRIIEDFMLLANETVAEEYCLADLPFVYRIHENPDQEKMEPVLQQLHQAGVKVKKTRQEIHPKEIQKILHSLKGTKAEGMYSRLLLRSMKQAKYSPECAGHFGLAARYYCHFTSPIRRYPDLQIHRIIKENLHGKLTEERIIHYNKILEEVSRQSSAMERRAEEVERETDKLKKAEFMSHHIGETFEGVISGVMEWGLYIELANTVEGLVHVNSLRDDYYAFDPQKFLLVGEMTKRMYYLGQKVTVRVKDADIMNKTIDFVLAEEMREEDYE
ncbi:MAG: ribonuclease R [Lachnospiraceae bacterium]